MYGGEMSSGRRAGPTNTASAAGHGAMLAPQKAPAPLGSQTRVGEWEKGFWAKAENPSVSLCSLLGSPGHPFLLTFRGRSYSQAFKIAGLSHPLGRN